MTAITVIALSQVPGGLTDLSPAAHKVGQFSGVASAPTESADSRAQDLAVRVSAPVKCPDAKRGLRFYVRRHADWYNKMGAGRELAAVTSLGHPVGKQRACPRYLAQVWKRKSFAARTRAEVWIATHVLRDFRVVDGARAWHRAVQEAQRPYPGTAAWLMSCSASEGGWGRWVPNSQGAPPGGWMQMYHSTFVRMFSAAKFDLASRGFIVPYSAHSWYSPLGQALASAWGLKNGRRHEWSGAGC